MSEKEEKEFGWPLKSLRLSRKRGECIYIDGPALIEVVDKTRVELFVHAPVETHIKRAELIGLRPPNRKRKQKRKPQQVQVVTEGPGNQA